MDGTHIIISVSHSPNIYDDVSSAVIWQPRFYDKRTVGEFVVFSLMQAIENRASFARTCPENKGELEIREDYEAKALPILEELIGSERFPEVKKRLENLTSPNGIYPILDELNLFSEEKKPNPHI